MKPKELLGAALLALPALLGVTAFSLLAGLDMGQAATQRALVIALVTTLVLALAVNRWTAERARTEQDRELSRRLRVTDATTGLGNRRGLDEALGADLRGICTLIELKPELDGPPIGFAEILRKATREEQDELFHDQGRFWALLHETSPQQAEVVLGRVREAFRGELAVGKARYQAGEPAASWLERVRP